MRRAVAGLIAMCVAGCSPGYVVQAAYQQGKILLGRRQIEQVILDPDTSPEDREKLRLVVKAREFASQIGLRTGRSFTAYTDVGKDTLAWLVVASRKDSFSLYTWWFPIVGSVPYKGFFDERSALDQALVLEGEGYESSVRGTEAFSTLGWFNDPLLSTTLKNTPVRVVNTVLHENVHSTVWIKNNVAFNESLANFVGSRATIEFFTAQLSECSVRGGECGLFETWRANAESESGFQREFSDLIMSLYDQLERLYGDASIERAEKLRQREVIFEGLMGPFRARFPKMTALRTINNAEIIQFKLYLTHLRLFERLFAKGNGSWESFFEAMRGVQRAVEEDNSTDPFKLLQDMV